MSWFETWFDSAYYHILYQHRNEKDAELFLDHLLAFLNPEACSSMLDLGCGRGRHSIYLNNKGYTVTGIDLSRESISHCLDYENETLSFFVHDMRRLFRINAFDYVLNLFTSFGYFERDSENIAAMKNACLAVREGGTIVIDYLNATQVKRNLIPEETVVQDGILFQISRRFRDGFFLKDIRFQDQGKSYHFTEKVAALEISDFERYLKPFGVKIDKVFGNYDLQPFDQNNSPRLIIIAVKD